MRGGSKRIENTKHLPYSAGSSRTAVSERASAVLGFDLKEQHWPRGSSKLATSKVCRLLRHRYECTPKCRAMPLRRTNHPVVRLVALNGRMLTQFPAASIGSVPAGRQIAPIGWRHPRLPTTG